MQVASVGAGDAGEGEAAGAGNEENGWTHQGSQRCVCKKISKGALIT